MDIQEIGFGDFCTIEQKRYVGPNEFYSYKVVGRKKSNVWTDVPVDANNEKETLHDHLDDVVTVVCNNLDDRTVHQFRVSDLASVRKAQTVPECTWSRNDRLLVKSIREHVESHISEISVNDLFDKGWLAAMKCIQNNIDMLEAQEPDA